LDFFELLSATGSRWLLARVDGRLSQSVPAHVGEVMLIAIPVDVARAEQPP
jgi:hypothetical protein